MSSLLSLRPSLHFLVFFFFQAEDGIRDWSVTGVQTCALPIFTKAIAPYVLRSNRVQPPSTSAMTGEGYQFLQPEQIHRHRRFPATMLPNVCSTFAICIWASAFASLPSSGVLSSSNSFANGLPNGVSLPFVGSPSRQSVQHFRGARLVRITLGGFAIWLDPFRMLDPQIVVNLLLEFGVRVDLMILVNWPRSNIQVRRGTYPTKVLSRMADGHRC